MTTLAVAVDTFRRCASGWLHRLSVRLQPAVDEDPHAWVVSVVKIAAAADCRADAICAVHDVTKHLDEKTVHMVLLLLAQDAAWSLGSPAEAARWAELRKFLQIVSTVGEFDESA